MDRYIGKMLDNRYEILELIGSGGMSLVYKAKCHLLNRMVAVKILKEEYLKDAEFRRRFHNEAQAVAMLSHPNIVSVYDVSRYGGIEYMVMELIEGITLKDYMQRKGVLSWKETLYFAAQTANALEHAHSRGIIHRDIKPHNIMLLRDSTLKVADFGIARLMMQKQQSLLQEALGSVHYVSPEQAKGSFIDARTDIYSLGVVMYEMLTGRLPFEGDNPISVAMQHINAIPLMPTEINSSIPKGMEQITMKAMCPDITKRYSSASQMLLDMEMLKNNPSMIFPYSAASSGAEIADNSGSERTIKIDDISNRMKNAIETPRTMDGYDGINIEGIAGSKPSDISRGEYSDDDDEYDSNEYDDDFYKDEAPRREKRRRGGSSVFTISIAVLVTLTFFVCAMLFAWNVLFGDTTSPEGTTVPALEGLLLDYVLSNEEYSKSFKFDYSNMMYHASKPDGTILLQSPEAGKAAKIGDTIYLTVSRGQKPITIPDLRNLEYRTAELSLSKIGILYKEAYEPSDTVAEGYIIRTEPASTETVYEGDIITLVISQGVTVGTAVVPKLIGLTEMNARLAIESAGLTVGVVTPVDSPDKDGIVLEQSIASGIEVDEKTPIDLTVGMSSHITQSSNTEPSNTISNTPKPTETDPIIPGPGNQTEGSISSQKQTSTEAITEAPTQPTKKELKYYSLPVNLEKYSGEVRVTVKLNGEVVYDEMRNASEKIIYITLSGNGTGYAHLYIDNKNVASQLIVFE